MLNNMQQKKYEFTGLTREYDGHILHQIRALRPLELSDIEAGTVGGWIETEDNLSHEGDCWVYPEAYILEQASVEGDCRITDRAIVRGQAKLRGFILAEHDTLVTDDAIIENVCRLTGDTVIYGKAVIACGEDGPQILPGLQIDFNVSYDERYIAFGTAYHGYLVAISQTGRICISASSHSQRWAGSLAELANWKQQQLEDDPEVTQIEQFIASYLGGNGFTSPLAAHKE